MFTSVILFYRKGKLTRLSFSKSYAQRRLPPQPIGRGSYEVSRLIKITRSGTVCFNAHVSSRLFRRGVNNTRRMPTTINHSTRKPAAGPRVTPPRGEGNENLLSDKHTHPLTTNCNVAFVRTRSITVGTYHIINLFLSYRTISCQTDSGRHVHVRFAGVDLLDGARRRDGRQLARVARRVPSSVRAAE